MMLKKLQLCLKKWKKHSASANNSTNEHDIKWSTEKGSCKQLILDTQREFTDDVLNATPKDGVNCWKYMGGIRIL